MDPQSSAGTARGRQRLDQQSHVGPGGLPAGLGRTHQQPEGGALLGGQLEAAEAAAVQPIDPGEGGGCGGTPQGLVHGPEEIGLAPGMHDHDLRRRQSEPDGGGRVELALAVDHHQGARVAAGLAGGLEGERFGPGPFAGSQPLGQRAAQEAAAGQEPIQGGAGGGNGRLEGPLPSPLELGDSAAERLQDVGRW